MGKAFLLLEWRDSFGGDSVSRAGRRNKQKMFYALWLQDQPVYDKDRDGNIRVDDDGFPIETGDTKDVYSEPMEFHACIVGSGGQVEQQAFGAFGDYDALLYARKGDLPLSENTLIWYRNDPKLKGDGSVDEKSADYVVKRVPPSLNEIVYLLKSTV